MDTPAPHDEKHPSLAQQIRSMFVDFEQEAEREIHIPHDLSGSDAIFRKHTNGFVITGFTLVGLFLVAAIVAIALH